MSGIWLIKEVHYIKEVLYGVPEIAPKWASCVVTQNVKYNVPSSGTSF